MFALDRSSRALLAAGAFAAFAGAFVTTPFAARGAAGSTVPAPRVAPLPPPPAFAAVVPQRDPFAGAPAGASASMATTAQTIAAQTTSAPPAFPAIPTMPTMPTTTSIPAAIGPLPPNAGAAGVVLPFAPNARVTAVVTGTPPFALVDEAGTTRIVTTGDRVDGDAIVAIAADGVRLARGTTLLVTPLTPLRRPIPGGR